MKKRQEYKKGDIINNCSFLEELPPIRYGCGSLKRVGKFKCRCSKDFITLIEHVKRGNTSSCGCVQKERTSIAAKESSKIHGQKLHRLYSVWANMKDRCYNEKNYAYHNYGGRGIRVCDRWKDINFFINDMFPSYKEGYQIDRIDNDGNYCLENCRWVTPKENSNNRRNNRYVEFDGKKLTLSQWADFTGLKQTTLSSRLNILKFTVEKALTLPYKGIAKQEIKKELENG